MLNRGAGKPRQSGSCIKHHQTTTVWEGSHSTPSGRCCTSISDAQKLQPRGYGCKEVLVLFLLVVILKAGVKWPKRSGLFPSQAAPPAVMSVIESNLAPLSECCCFSHACSGCTNPHLQAIFVVDLTHIHSATNWDPLSTTSKKAQNGHVERNSEGSKGEKPGRTSCSEHMHSQPARYRGQGSALSQTARTRSTFQQVFCSMKRQDNFPSESNSSSMCVCVCIDWHHDCPAVAVLVSRSQGPLYQNKTSTSKSAVCCGLNSQKLANQCFRFTMFV